jgi:hypothetical protein
MRDDANDPPLLRWASEEHQATSQAELEIFERVTSRELGGTPRFILEIGTRMCGLAYRLVKMQPEVFVSIDLPGLSRGMVYSKMHKVCDRLGVDYYPLEGDSHHGEVKLMLRSIISAVGHAPDAVVVDGDHSLHGVRRDFADYAALSADRAVIFIHDVETGGEPPNAYGEPNVSIFWEELVASDHPYRLEKHVPPNQTGYGVVIKEASSEG